MVDGARVYRRWLWKKLCLLAPVLLVVLMLAIGIALETRLPFWLKFPSVAIAASLAVLLGFLSLAARRSARLALEGRRGEARILRSELRLSPWAAVLSLLLLVPLFLLPSMFHEGPQAPAIVRRRPPPSPAIGRSNIVVPVDPTIPEPEPPPLPVAEAEPPAPEPRLHPALSDLPRAITLADSDFALLRPELPALPDQDPRPPVPEERDTAPFHLALADYLQLRTPGPSPLGIDRAGMPDERDPEAWPALQVAVEMMVALPSRGLYGAVWEVSFELPIDARDLLQITGLVAGLSDKEGPVELEPTLAWYRGEAAFVHRIVGYTRHAPLDLAAGAGLSLDWATTHEAGLETEPAFRFAPWAGVDLALWHEGGLGFLFHAGQSFATPLSDSSSVTDLKAVVKLDLSESLSLSAGYRYLRFRFLDHGSKELGGSLSGPLFGLDVRF